MIVTTSKKSSDRLRVEAVLIYMRDGYTESFATCPATYKPDTQTHLLVLGVSHT